MQTPSRVLLTVQSLWPACQVVLARRVVSPDTARERERKRGRAETLSFPLAYKAAHRRPARLVVRGLRDTIEAFVPCHLAIRHSLIHGGGRGVSFKDGESLKTEGPREDGAAGVVAGMVTHVDSTPALSSPALSLPAIAAGIKDPHRAAQSCLDHFVNSRRPSLQLPPFSVLHC